MGYDAMALGPQDLTLGLEVLRERMAEAAFAIVSANLTVEGQLLAPPYVLLEREGATIAVLGLTGPPRAAMEEPVEVGDPVAAALQHFPALADQAHLVIVLSNLGPAAERELAQQVPRIDLVVGGGAGAPQSEVAWQGAVALVRAGGLGEYLGITEVVLGERGSPPAVSSKSLTLGPEIMDDGEITALKTRYLQEYYAQSTGTPG